MHLQGLIRCVPGFGLYFSLLHFLNKNIASEDPSALETFLLGAVARTAAATCFVPVTVLKTRFEVKMLAFELCYLSFVVKCILVLYVL